MSCIYKWLKAAQPVRTWHDNEGLSAYIYIYMDQLITSNPEI